MKFFMFIVALLTALLILLFTHGNGVDIVLVVCGIVMGGCTFHRSKDSNLGILSKLIE